MRYCSVIEDLDQEQFQILTHKNHQDLLTDSFIRNFGLIRKYAHEENQLFITKFKKKIIPRYVQGLEDYCEAQILKNRQLFYAKRKQIQYEARDLKKNRKSLPELGKNILFSQQDNRLSQDQVLEQCPFHKSYPILYNEKFLPHKSKASQKVPPSQKLILGPAFLFSPKKKPTELQKFSIRYEKPSISYQNNYTGSISFCQNFLFKSTFEHIGIKKESRQSTEGLSELFNVKKTLPDEKSIERKMINVLKKRKSSKNLKIKIFSGYINSKKALVDTKEKENASNPERNSFKTQPTEPILKKKMNQMSLKGKLCIPMKYHRVTNSCNLTQPNFPKQKIQLMSEIIDLPSINGRNNILISTQNKFTLPKFS